MRESIRSGIAIYNAGYYHAAHDAWEERWLDLEAGTENERLLHGLIQFTAAIYHATRRNWDGCAGLAESAGEYLDGLSEEYRGVDLHPVRASLDDLSSDPEVIERRPPIQLRHEGDVVTFVDLTVPEAAIAAGVLAEELEYDEGPIDRAGKYAVTDLEAGRDDSAFIALLFDFLREDDHRSIVFDRLCQHVDRREGREGDVEGLF